MTESDEISFDTKENNEENIPVDQRSIKVTIRSNLDPIVFEIAGDDNVDFIKQNILIGNPKKLFPFDKEKFKSWKNGENRKKHRT